MLNKLQAIIKNMIITFYCLARSSVGVLVLRAGQSSLMLRDEDPQKGSTLIPGLSQLIAKEVAMGAEGCF